jgi:hypothetical protein
MFAGFVRHAQTFFRREGHVIRPATVSRAVFGAAIAAALGFGATQLVAAPIHASCPYDPGIGELGACTTTAACQQSCVNAGFGGAGLCRGGCCTCVT